MTKKHLMKLKDEEVFYCCNEAIHALSKNMTCTISEVTCLNCLRLIKKGVRL